jgi:ribosomal protein S18 acetylase RimI-like enzyme
MNINLRYANRSDAEMLTEIGIKTFSDTFLKDNNPEDMDIYLKKAFSVELHLKELVDPNIVFLIAEIDGKPAGYAKLKAYSKIDGLIETDSMEIERIYSLKEYIGKGIGKALMEASIKEAKEKGFSSIWLGVWERNTRAIAFYEKWGFKIIGSHIFMLGKDPQNDFIMLLDKVLDKKKWEVWRQDDNGIKVLIETFIEKSKAEEKLKYLESFSHKQIYWIE